MTATHEEINLALKRLISGLIDGIMLDPTFEYNIYSIDYLPNHPERPEEIGTWVIHIETSSRAKLLGQFPPFSVGGYRGLYENLYTGQAIQFLHSEFGRKDYVTLDVQSSTTRETEKQTFQQRLSLGEALDANILNSDTHLVDKMRQYSITTVTLLGGSFVTGPVLDTITAIEHAIETKNPTKILDCYSGIGTVSAVALANNVDTVVALDKDTSAIKSQPFSTATQPTIRELDINMYTPKQSFDLVVADPYYTHVPTFIEDIFPKIVPHSNHALLGLGYITDYSWINHMHQLMSVEPKTTEQIETKEHYWELLELPQ